MSTGLPLVFTITQETGADVTSVLIDRSCCNPRARGGGLRLSAELYHPIRTLIFNKAGAVKLRNVQWKGAAFARWREPSVNFA
jgi:hypothetical protein